MFNWVELIQRELSKQIKQWETGVMIAKKSVFTDPENLETHNQPSEE